ncbi:hypothetical protein [Cochleicola gelatinilyticus]|uniref:Curlin n=1 Tax=Cochleicola gelatinilyticus TaxID=1763537 RepID=A0A167ERT9_9FLAO|nr:hypothetical protein [Cochleicola gelatinilyticus]OAB75823.1 hypothetical protein ULVI_15215 [Cochleicola gelatinilyticus]
MKKVILSAMALMAGSLVFAQVSGDAAAPQAQQADYASGASMPSNAVENIQSGVENYMLVRQEGTSSSVYIDQSEGGAGVGNLIYVRQSGDVDGNEADSGEGNMADVRQAGTNNDGFVRQEGDFNEAAMVQNAGSDNNIGYIRQGTGQNAENNYAGLVQDGSGNSGWIQQTFDNSEALTLQDGTNHQALTVQDANPNNSNGHDAKVEQLGDQQKSYVSQIGSDSRADVFQEGDQNYSDVKQSGTGVNVADVDQSGSLNQSFIVSAGNGQNATVFQDGDENAADVGQSGAAVNNAHVVQIGNGDYANQRQTNAAGADNNALINQGDLANALSLSELDVLYDATNGVLDTEFGNPSPGSFNGVAYQTQNGDGNRAESHQFGDESFIDFSPFPGIQPVGPNYSKQEQTGSGNEALVVQNAFHGLGPFTDAIIPDGENTALQVQTGNNNSVSLIQRDLGNDAWQIQDGEDSAMGVQIGYNNNLVTKQYQGSNFMETGQAGGELNLYAAQRGGQSFIGDQSGLFNTMEVLQVGPEGMDMFETINCDIPDPMTPMQLPEMETLTIPGIDTPELCADC